MTIELCFPQTQVEGDKDKTNSQFAIRNSQLIQPPTRGGVFTYLGKQGFFRPPGARF
ncbi:MAG: hypothetical protein ACRAVC_06945 [Trichormus sp.]